MSVAHLSDAGTCRRLQAGIRRDPNHRHSHGAPDAEVTMVTWPLFKIVIFFFFFLSKVFIEASRYNMFFQPSTSSYLRFNQHY